ncbi:hypothetical protein [Streptomyces sp. SJL17-4]|uniref:hypothetical protein n=1 Tax=Streptomyces sp. SJL17-4 TaxID=2967224 RepID=UPI0030D59893
MTLHNELRLLPWSSPDGKPCYLSTDDEDSHLSRLADSTEAIQLCDAAELVAHALEVIGNEGTESDELRSLSADLVEALRDTLRVATSRGYRLQAPGFADRTGKDAPRQSAAAFG